MSSCALQTPAVTHGPATPVARFYQRSVAAAGHLFVRTHVTVRTLPFAGGVLPAWGCRSSAATRSERPRSSGAHRCGIRLSCGGALSLRAGCGSRRRLTLQGSQQVDCNSVLMCVKFHCFEVHLVAAAAGLHCRGLAAPAACAKRNASSMPAGMLNFLSVLFPKKRLSGSCCAAPSEDHFYI